MDWAAKSRPAPPSSRRYYLSRRPCPQDGIIKPTASLEKKIEANTEEVPVSSFFLLRHCRITIILNVIDKSLTLRVEKNMINQLNQ